MTWRSYDEWCGEAKYVRDCAIATHEHNFQKDKSGFLVCECGAELIECPECGFTNIGTREENEEEFDFHVAQTQHTVGD